MKTRNRFPERSYLQEERGCEDFFGSTRSLTFSSHSLAIVLSAASEVLLLIWEGQPRHARQAHWGMDSTQQPAGLGNSAG
jgi:hypothetical protein